MQKLVKTAALYIIAAIVVAIGLYFVVKKDTYLAFALPMVVGVLLLYVFSSTPLGKAVKLGEKLQSLKSRARERKHTGIHTPLARVPVPRPQCLSKTGSQWELSRRRRRAGVAGLTRVLAPRKS